MTDEEIINRLDRVVDVLETNRSWLRLLAIGNLKSTIQSTFEDEWEYYLYDRLDGDTKIDGLIEGLPTSSSTAHRRLRRWHSMGIARKSEDGKYEHLSSLDDVGIELPKLD